jgi:hypothetical protein
MVSIRTRRKHRKNYPSRRSLRAETPPPPSTLISMDHPGTQFEYQEDNGDLIRSDYLRVGDGLPDPLLDIGEDGEDLGFKDNESDDGGPDDSTSEEEEVDDEDEDDPSDDDMEGGGEQFYDDI